MLRIPEHDLGATASGLSLSRLVNPITRSDVEVAGGAAADTATVRCMGPDGMTTRTVAAHAEGQAGAPRFDCFMFRDELDMLEMRLHGLDGKVCDAWHVIVESPRTHRGIAKPLVFQENLDRFKPWLDRILHVIAEPEPGLQPWGCRARPARCHV